MGRLRTRITAVTLSVAVVSAGLLVLTGASFAQSQATTTEADNTAARAFRDEWLKKFDGKRPTMPALPPGVDAASLFPDEPELLEWRDFSLSLSVMAKELTVDPTRRVTPGATRGITRTVIQALLMTAWGGGVSGVLMRPDVPRDVYDEKIADEQAQIRLNVMAEAVRLYVGESEAAEFTAATPAVKVQLASRAALGMIEDQKKNWPNAMLLLYATMGRIEPDMIEDLLGKNSEQFRQFMVEPSLRVRSMYVADAFAAMMKRVGEVPLSGPDFDNFAKDALKMNLERERQRPERAVLESLGNEGRERYRDAKGKNREEVVNGALLLKALGVASWSFATFTPETIPSLFDK